MYKYKNVKTDLLKPYKNNARVHSEEQINKIVKSIKEFGFINPILIDEKFKIIAGHGRFLGAKKIGLVEVPCLFVEDLTEKQKKAYIIADNKIALDSNWDYNKLIFELNELKEFGFDVELSGFDFGEINMLISDNNDIQENKYDELNYKEVSSKFHVCPECGCEFE